MEKDKNKQNQNNDKVEEKKQEEQKDYRPMYEGDVPMFG